MDFQSFLFYFYGDRSVCGSVAVLLWVWVAGKQDLGGDQSGRKSSRRRKEGVGLEPSLLFLLALFAPSISSEEEEARKTNLPIVQKENKKSLICLLTGLNRFFHRNNSLAVGDLSCEFVFLYPLLSPPFLISDHRFLPLDRTASIEARRRRRLAACITSCKRGRTDACPGVKGQFHETYNYAHDRYLTTAS